jgi:hypothetical protein
MISRARAKWVALTAHAAALRSTTAFPTTKEMAIKIKAIIVFAQNNEELRRKLPFW